MTKRDFFILIIKLFGLFSVVSSIFTILPSNIAFALTDVTTFSVIWIIASIVIMLGLFILLIFYSGNIVSMLRLDKGFDDDRIELSNLKPSDIIKIGTFIVGALLLLHHIPLFLSHTLFAFKGGVAGQPLNFKTKFDWTVSGLNILLGYLLLTNYAVVARLLQHKKQRNDNESNDL
jgi:hypothetical protein